MPNFSISEATGLTPTGGMNFSLVRMWEYDGVKYMSETRVCAKPLAAESLHHLMGIYLRGGTLTISRPETWEGVIAFIISDGSVTGAI